MKMGARGRRGQRWKRGHLRHEIYFLLLARRRPALPDPTAKDLNSNVGIGVDKHQRRAADYRDVAARYREYSIVAHRKLPIGLSRVDSQSGVESAQLLPPLPCAQLQSLPTIGQQSH